MILKKEEIKKLFNYILNNDHEIILDSDTNDILYIKHNNGEIKCKYILIFSTIENENNNNKNKNNKNKMKLLWSYNNKYIDAQTKNISLLIKNKIDKKEVDGKEVDKKEVDEKEVDEKEVDEKEIIIMVKKIIESEIIIKYEDITTRGLWIIRKKNKLYTQYFMIIDIIYL